MYKYVENRKKFQEGGRGREGGRGDCFCIDEIWDMRTRRGQEEDCYASEDCSAHFPGPTTVIIHTSRAACRQCHAGQAQKGCRFNFHFCRANVRTHCCQKRPRPSRNVDDYCVGRLRRGARQIEISSSSPSSIGVTLSWSFGRMTRAYFSVSALRSLAFSSALASKVTSAVEAAAASHL